MNRKRRRKRTHKNVTINYYYINVSSSDKKVSPIQKLALISTIISFISAVITLIAKLIG